MDDDSRRFQLTRNRAHSIGEAVLMKTAMTYAIVLMAIMISWLEIKLMRSWDAVKLQVEQVIE